MIRYSLVNTTSSFPTNAVQTFNEGFNIAGGNVESVIFRWQGTVATGDLGCDFLGCISASRVVLNGRAFHNYQAGYTLNQDLPSQYGYFLNSLSDDRFSTEVIGDTAKDCFMRIPVGVAAPSGVSRMEFTISTAALASAATGTLECWIVYNDAAETSTFVGNPTSLTAAAGQQEVVVRIPSNEAGVVAGVLVQSNDTTDANIESLRVTSQSDWTMDTAYWRFLNNDLQNGVIYMSDDLSATAGSYAQLCAGTIFVPTLGLSRESDVTMQITMAAGGAGDVVTFTPILVSQFNARECGMARQTQAVRTNTSKAILSTTGQADA
jgi:hypothetical protein